MVFRQSLFRADREVGVVPGNMAATAVANDANIQCKIINGLLVVDWEECPP